MRIASPTIMLMCSLCLASACGGGSDGTEGSSTADTDGASGSETGSSGGGDGGDGGGTGGGTSSSSTQGGTGPATDATGTATGTADTRLEYQWTRQWGTDGAETAEALVVFGASVYVTGDTTGAFEGFMREGSSDAFVSEYTTDGQLGWSVQYGGTYRDEGRAVRISAAGEVIVVGIYAQGQFLFQPFLMRLAPDGTVNDIERLSGSGGGAYGMVIGPGDFAYSVGGAGYTDSEDIFIRQDALDAGPTWPTDSYGSDVGDRAIDVALGPDDHLYLAGWTDGDLEGGTGAGETDVFATKYALDGTRLWTTQWGTADEDHGFGITVSADGGVYVTGTTTGVFEGSDSDTAGGDMFITRLDADGEIQWTVQSGSGQAESGRDIVATADGGLYVTGGGNYDENEDMISGGSDIYLARYDSDGVLDWLEQWGSTESDVGEGLATAQSGDVYVAGSSRGPIDGNDFAGEGDAFLTKWSPAP